MFPMNATHAHVIIHVQTMVEVEVRQKTFTT